MRYLTLAEALLIAEAVTGIPAATLARATRLDLLDSALHAPQAGFGEVEFYPAFAEKAAVLTVRLAGTHAVLRTQQLRTARACGRRGRPDARHRQR